MSIQAIYCLFVKRASAIASPGRLEQQVDTDRLSTMATPHTAAVRKGLGIGPAVLRRVLQFFLKRPNGGRVQFGEKSRNHLRPTPLFSSNGRVETASSGWRSARPSCDSTQEPVVITSIWIDFLSEVSPAISFYIRAVRRHRIRCRHLNAPAKTNRIDSGQVRW